MPRSAGQSEIGGGGKSCRTQCSLAKGYSDRNAKAQERRMHIQSTARVRRFLVSDYEDWIELEK